VVENFGVDAPKTKLLAQKLKGMGFDERADHHRRVDENLLLSSRNLPNVLVLEPRSRRSGQSDAHFGRC
jgi:large subunit ribosomal protein L4